MAANGSRLPIWSVRSETRTAYFVIFSLLFCTGVGLVAAFGETRPDQSIMQIVVARWAQAGAVALAAAAAAMVISETGGPTMVLLDRALDARDRNRERLRKEGREQGLEQGREQGLEQGIEQERAEWRAWFERREAALARGESFAEPPPGG